MFTGLIETVGKIDSISNRRNYKVLSIKPINSFDNIELGESIAIDGTCLTVVSFDKNSFTVEASQETIKKTILGQYRSSTSVNLERALKVGDRIGGHMISGHVDDIGTVSKIEASGDSIIIGIEFNKLYDNLVIEKGSIAIDGISLTVNSCKSGYFEINIIPHTSESTTINFYKNGREVNLEFDMIGKYINKMNNKTKNKSLTKKKLIESGW
jgi:riboflavin synthase